MTLESSFLVAMVVVWFGASLWSRMYGAMLGVVLASAVGCWGVWVMMHGQRMYIMGLARPLAPGAFYTLVSLMVLINAITALQSWRHAQRAG
jgi:hypothetical protein